MGKRTVVIILFLLSVAVPQSFAQGKGEDDYIDAVQLYTDGQYAKADSLLDKVIEADPSNDAAWYYKGLCEMYLGKKDDALASLEKAVAADSSNYWYMDRLALAYSTSGKTDSAVSEYEKLTELFPKKMDAWYTLTNLYLSKGEYSKAVDAISNIESFYGKSDMTVLTKYRALLMEQKQEEAFNVLKEYSEEYSSPQILSMLGDYETGIDNDSLAIGYYDQALALDSDYSPALLGKAESYRINRRYDKYFPAVDSIMSRDGIQASAKADYLRQLIQHADPKFLTTYRDQLDSTYDIMLERHPADTAALLGGGIYYFSTGRQDKAKEIFRKNMENNPSDLNATYYYLQSLSSSGDYMALADESEKAADRFPEEESSFENMSVYALYNLKDYRKVIEKCEAMIAHAPKDSAVCLEAYSTIGDMQHLLGEASKAYKAYDKALKINPSYAPVLNNYAYYLSLEGKSLSKAYKMSKITISQEPDNATYLDTFGWILHLQGKDLEAKPFFKHAMLYGGKDSATMLAHYAIVLEALGETDLANVYKAQAKAKAAEGGEEE